MTISGVPGEERMGSDLQKSGVLVSPQVKRGSRAGLGDQARLELADIQSWTQPFTIRCSRLFACFPAWSGLKEGGLIFLPGRTGKRTGMRNVDGSPATTIRETEYIHGRLSCRRISPMPCRFRGNTGFFGLQRPGADGHRNSSRPDTLYRRKAL